MLIQGRFAYLSLATEGVLTPIVGIGPKVGRCLGWCQGLLPGHSAGVFGRPVTVHLGSVYPHRRFEPKVGYALEGAKVFCPGISAGVFNRPIAGRLGSVYPHRWYGPKVGYALDGAKVFSTAAIVVVMLRIKICLYCMWGL